MERIVYSKYSAERDEKFAIRTDIVKKEDDTMVVRKYPLEKSGEQHVKKIYEWSHRLQEEYPKGQFLVNRCKNIDGGVEFEYLTGQTLQEKIRTMAAAGDEDGIEQMIASYVARIRQEKTWIRFKKTPEFIQIFGDVKISDGALCQKVTNIDMIFSNIILQGDVWSFIDYEWTFDFPIPIDFVLYRAFYLAFHELPDVKQLELAPMMERLGIYATDQQNYREMEIHFQQYVRGRKTPLRDLMMDTGHQHISFIDLQRGCGLQKEKLMVSWLDSEGRLISSQQEDSCNGNQFQKTFVVPEGACELKLEMPFGSGMAQLVEHKSEEMEQERDYLEANGMCLGDGIYVFQAKNAWMIFPAMGEEISIQMLWQTMDENLNHNFISYLNQLYADKAAVEDENITLWNEKTRFKRRVKRLFGGRSE